MHVPVLLHEVIKILDPKPNEFFIDGTVNGGGHAEEIVKRLQPNGMFLGIDLDKEVIRKTEIIINNYELKKKILVHSNYAALPKILKKHELPEADGLLLDLGFSSYQTQESGKGFSFLRDEPLDMRFDQNENLTAEKVINQFSEKELADIFFSLGEERRSRRIARAVVEERKKRPIRTTSDLVRVIEKVISRRGKIHPATRTFQALRIFVNQELQNLKVVLAGLPLIVKPGGRVAIISFHSLEDRLVKNSFKLFSAQGKAKILTSKPIIASKIEVQINPKSRSAKLRAIKLI